MATIQRPEPRDVPRGWGGEAPSAEEQARYAVLSRDERKAVDVLATTVALAKLKGSGTSSQIEAAEIVLGTLNRLCGAIASGEGAT